VSAGSKPGYIQGVRREHRIAGCKPVTVLGKDINGNAFSQNTFTVEISATGARLQGLPPVALSSVLFLECGQENARYRVVWIGEKGTSNAGQVGLQCIDPDKTIFGLAPPKAGSFYDEYKRVEAELHRTEERYRNLFNNSLGFICTHDLHGRLLSMNPAAAFAVGCQAEDTLGKNIASFLAPSVRSKFPEYLRKIRHCGQDSGYMLVVGRNRMKRIWFYRNLLVHEQGSPPYVVGHAMDITDQKNTQHELEKALGELQKASAEVRTLKGLLPICAWCKKIQTQSGEWVQLESFITENSEAHFSHGLCSECLPKLKSRYNEESQNGNGSNPSPEI
jgi:PAS domain S-box-containing protein